ncbi:coiled-coil domain-containing protein 82-like isoform X1 [Salvelinus fontinalis]|uniref:coiled-coil domain-containing protein 82-like isoform X1 n=1 Tax=Salvelinus fontinalis TaxID=8038 RepID=UPI002485C61C|nr:coiled-coil domain-containing protein 82-like isoform X1 [Salvelinus fontinalis]
MESLYKRKVFATLRKNKAEASKKRAQIGLPSSILDDSDEESCASTTSISASESDYQNSDSGSESTPASGEQSPASDGSSSSEGRCRPRRKRVLADSSSDSDSDVGTKPKRKVVPKKRVKQQSHDSDSEDESAAEKDKKVAEAKQTAAKRKQRQSKLLALSKKVKSRVPKRRGTLEDSSDEDKGKVAEDVSGDNDEEEDTPELLLGSSEEEAADHSDSLKDFIVEDKTGDKNEEVSDEIAVSLPRQFITGSQLNHFQVVLKALMINVLDETFLKSLYAGGDRTKRYAQEMKASLFHFDERTILPRLENLKQRSRWTDRYKERVECYPKVRLLKLGLHRSVCEACKLQRQCSFSVRLSGQLYDLNSLEEDQFMPDDTQAFSVGSVCASRTEVYHALKHFKYHLFQHCRTVMEEEEKNGEEPVKETVKRVFTKLEERGWISEQYEKFQDHLNDADYFQEEKLD